MLLKRVPKPQPRPAAPPPPPPPSATPRPACPFTYDDCMHERLHHERVSARSSR
jgi:hypothetical protein